MAAILPPGKVTFYNSNNVPLVLGTVDFYEPGTTTRKTTYQDIGLTIPNANPVVLDTNGQAVLWGSGAYRQVVKDSSGNLIWDQITSALDGTGLAASGANTDITALLGLTSPIPGSDAPVKSASTTSPPSTPADGDRYIVPTGASGAWSGQATKITQWNATKAGWYFSTPAQGTTIYVQDTNAWNTFNGTSWTASADLKSSWFSTPAAADTAANSSSSEVSLDSNFTLSGNAVYSAKWRPHGGVITRGTNTVTFNNAVSEAGMQMFDASGTGLVTFVRIPRIDVRAFGVKGDGATDDANALTQAILSANASKSVLFGNNSLACNLKSGITIPPTLRAEFNGMRVQPDATLTSGYLVTVDGTQTGYVGTVLGRISGLQIFQALTSNHADTSRNVDGMALGSATSASSLRFDDLDIQGFRDLLAVKGPNVYIEGFYNTRLYNGWRRGISNLATSNSGESYAFYGGSISNINNTTFDGTGLYVDQTVTASEFKFHGTSFDYCDVSVENHVGRVNCFGCHFENNNGNSHVKLFKHSSRLPSDFIMHGGYLGGGSGTVSWTGISAESATGRASYIETTGGSQTVEVIGVKCGGFNATDQVTEIVRQTDSSAPRRISIKPILDAGTGTGSSVPLALSFKVNSLYLSTTDLSSWTQNGSSGTTQSFDSVTVYAPDVGSRKTVSASGNSSSLASKLMPCRPGDNVVAKVYLNCTTFTSGGYFAIQLKFFAGDGTTQIGSQTESNQVTAATSGWVPLWVPMRVPDGAAYVQLLDYCNLFTGTVYFSNEHVWVY